MRLQNLTASAEQILKKTHQTHAASGKRFDGVNLIDLWDDVAKDLVLSKTQKQALLPDFYTELLQDQRFVNLGNNKWKLREFIPFDDYKKIKSAMYGIENLERIEEEGRTKDVVDNKTLQIDAEPEEIPLEEEIPLAPNDNEDGE